jgi:molybdopterin synthase sulfur carrier subunit
MRVVLPSPLASYTGGVSQTEGQGATLAELLSHLDARYPGLRFRIIDEQDCIRRHIRIFVNGAMTSSLATRLAPEDDVIVVAALSGG